MCQNQMFRNELESGDDIRLSTRLFNKCLGDYQKYCKDIEPGHMRVQECLEDNVDESDFTGECKEELESVIAKRVNDFRLDIALREACEADIKDTCGTSLVDMDKDDKVKERGLNCLQQYKEELKSDKCKDEVHRRMTRAARDIRFDEVLASACTEDRSRFCSDVQPVREGGHARCRAWGRGELCWGCICLCVGRGGGDGLPPSWLCMLPACRPSPRMPACVLVRRARHASSAACRTTATAWTRSARQRSLTTRSRWLRTLTSSTR